MRIRPFSSGGKISDTDWFLNYCDIKLVRPASKIERMDGFQGFVVVNIEAMLAF